MDFENKILDMYSIISEIDNRFLFYRAKVYDLAKPTAEQYKELVDKDREIIKLIKEKLGLL